MTRIYCLRSVKPCTRGFTHSFSFNLSSSGSYAKSTLISRGKIPRRRFCIHEVADLAYKSHGGYHFKFTLPPVHVRGPLVTRRDGTLQRLKGQKKAFQASSAAWRECYNRMHRHHHQRDHLFLWINEQRLDGIPGTG